MSENISSFNDPFRKKRPYYGGGGHGRLTLEERRIKRPQALKLYRSGKSTIRISDELGIPVATVTYWVKNAGIMRSRAESAIIARRNRLRTIENMMDQAVEMYNQGRWAVPEIARLIGVPGKRPDTRVYHWLRLRGVTRSHADGTKLRYARQRTAQAPTVLNPVVSVPKVA